MALRGAGLATECEIISVNGAATTSDRELLMRLGARQTVTKTPMISRTIVDLMHEVGASAFAHGGGWLSTSAIGNRCTPNVTPPPNCCATTPGACAPAWLRSVVMALSTVEPQAFARTPTAQAVRAAACSCKRGPLAGREDSGPLRKAMTTRGVGS